MANYVLLTICKIKQALMKGVREINRRRNTGNFTLHLNIDK